jgi:hypothetical protein
MVDAFAGDAVTKAHMLADVVNRTLHDLVLRCTKTEEIRDYFHVALVGYGAEGVGSAFAGSLAGRGLVPISDVGNSPARVDTRTKKVSDNVGGLVDQTVMFPIWAEATAGGSTPMCAALSEAHRLLTEWLANHQACFPPVVLHITDGESTDGDPRQAGQALAGLRSSDGNVLVFNCHLSSERAPKIEYPASSEGLPNDWARTLFDISSVLPSGFVQVGSEIGQSLAAGARGFVFNGDVESLVQFFDIGTRPAILR